MTRKNHYERSTGRGGGAVALNSKITKGRKFDKEMTHIRGEFLLKKQSVP
jgi:hypothetical protein